MPRFEPDPRLLRTLVGSNLYPSADVCVRELVQNAWDAITWRRELADGQGGRIVVRYSEAGRWFEVEDDGIGMDSRDLAESFLKVGRNKLEALGATTQPGDQVAFFGIGVLSVFLVAERIEVETRKAGTAAADGVRLVLVGLEDDRDFESVERSPVGTTFRVVLRPDAPFAVAKVPEAVKQYVRHVPGVVIENSDAGTSEAVDERWETAAFSPGRVVSTDPRVRSGRLAIHSSLVGGNPIANRITLCNAGFLVEVALDLLPIEPMGIVGEVDLHPGPLNILMARGRFQRDDAWKALGESLMNDVEALVREAIEVGPMAPRDGQVDDPPVRRALLIWLQTASGGGRRSLSDTLEERIWSTLGFPLTYEPRAATLDSLVRELPAPRLYYRKVGTATRAARTVDDEGLPVQFTMEIHDTVRVAALRVKGFRTIDVGQPGFTVERNTGAVNRTIDEAEVVRQLLAARGVEGLDLYDARAEDIDLQSVEKLPALRALLLGERLGLAEFPETGRRVITDRAGTRWLNTRHPAVRRLLMQVGQALSNPLKRRLLGAYLDIEDFRIPEARNALLALLESSELGVMAQAETAPLTAEAIRAAVATELTKS